MGGFWGCTNGDERWKHKAKSTFLSFFSFFLPPSIYGNSSLQPLVLKDPFVLLSQLLLWKAVS